MVEKNQKMRYNKQELSVLASSLKDNEEVVYALRKFLLQVDMPEQEDVILKKAVSPELVQILRKEFVGGVEYEVPLLMAHDPYVFKETTTLDPESLYNMAEGKMKVVEYFENQLEELATGEKNLIKLDDMKPKRAQDKVERYVGLYARSVIISVIDMALNDFMILANKSVEETEEEKEERIKKDSSK